MQSEIGWDIPLLKTRNGQRVYYRYESKDYSIKKQPLNTTEIEQLKEAIYMLNRFSGLPQFDWLNDMLVHFQTTSHLNDNIKTVVFFDENPDLKELKYFSPLFNAIINHQVLRIAYKYFEHSEIGMTIHPYFLKQYNDRWFLFGFNPENNKNNLLTDLQIDRIVRYHTVNENYIENNDLNVTDSFYNIIGVSSETNKKLETIRLKIENGVFNDLDSKPFHPTQKIIKKLNDSVIIELRLITNFEFETRLLSYADHIEILKPQSLKNDIKKRAGKIIEKNKK